MRLIIKTIVVMVCYLASTGLNAAAFFETGRATVSNTVNNGGWVTVNLQKSYISPVVIAGPVSHNNTNSLSARVRNVTANSFQIGIQSPCQSYNRYNSTTPPAANTCPIGGSWSSESVNWIVIEQGTWVFPDGTKIEAYNHNTSTTRAKGGSANAADVISYSHTYAAPPALIHGVSSYNDARWISSVSWSPTGGRSAVPNSVGFSLGMEGGEAVTSHGTETIGWLAMEASNGTNLGNVYTAGRIGRNIDRHSDECQLINFGVTFSSIPSVVVKKNTMSGGDGAWVRLCGAEVSTSNFRVHMDEDQVTDTERTGVEEAASWFAFESGAFGQLQFLTATKTVADDDNDGVAGPGELLTYEVTINNLQDDFQQLNNASSTLPEFMDVLNANVTFDSVVSASTGTLSFNSGANRVEWNGTVQESATVILQYRVKVNEDVAICSLSTIDNQGQLNMDPIADDVEAGDVDNLNRIEEITDDPGRDDGSDVDGDTATDDDDSTIITTACLVDIEVNKSDGLTGYQPGNSRNYTIIITNNGPHTLTGGQVSDTLPAGLSFDGPVSCTITTGSGVCGTQTITGQDYSQVIDLSSGGAATIVIPVSYSGDPEEH